MKKMKNIHLIVGVGEVGQALVKLLKDKTELYWFDQKPRIANNLPDSLKKVDVLHICYPQTSDFLRISRQYVKEFSPELVVNHSTTMPGKTNKIAKNCVHSPIIGQHSQLAKHIDSFRKAVGPNNDKSKKLAKKYLENLFKLEFFDDSQTTELAKILALSKFAVNIEFARYAQKACDKTKIDYSQAYTKFSNLYNDGYEQNGLKQFVSPVLRPPVGPIGGSCVIPGTQKAHKILKSASLKNILRNSDAKRK